MIEAEDISIKFIDKEVVKGLSFQINKGDKFAFAGPSGSGKTSLLNVIMGFTNIIEGKLIYEGKVSGIEVIKEFRKKISWIPQDIFINYESGFGLIKQINKDKFKKKDLKLLLDKAALDENLLNKPMNLLSGGEKQRLLIVASLLKNKEILIMDEPTSALDDKNIENMISLILNSKEHTLICTSHNKEWLDRCTKVFYL